MKGHELAHLLETTPYVEFEARLLKAAGAGLQEFVDSVIEELKTERYAKVEVAVSELSGFLSAYPVPVAAQREGWDRAVVNLLS